MKNFKQIYEQLETDDWLFEMTGVSSRDSGLDHFIWISPKGNNKHSIRIKVSNVPRKFAANDHFYVMPDREIIYAESYDDAKNKLKTRNTKNSYLVIDHIEEI